MRFLLFNFVVAAAVIYLVTGGSLETLTSIGVSGSVFDTIEEAKGQFSGSVKNVGTEIKKATIASNPIKPPIKGPNNPAVKAEPKLIPVAAKPEPKLPPLSKAKWISEAKPKRPGETLTAIKPRQFKPRKVAARQAKFRNRVAPDVKRRRDEIFSNIPEALAKAPATPAAAPKKTYAVKDGEKLMSPSQRRRELRALVEDMELLYLDKAGG